MQAQIRRGRNRRRQHHLAHGAPPQQRRPIIGARLQRLLVDQGIIRCGQRVVHHHLHPAPGQHGILVQVTETVEEGRRPGGAATGRLCRFGVPDRLAGFKLVPQRRIMVKLDQRAVQPGRAERLVLFGRGNAQAGTTLRHAAIEMIADGIEAARVGSQHVGTADQAPQGPGRNRRLHHRAFANAAGANDAHAGHCRAGPVPKPLEITAIIGSGIAGGHALRRGWGIGFVEEFGGGQGAACFAGQIDQALRLRRLPIACRIARAGAGGKAGDDARIDRFREIHHRAPLVALQHLGKAGRRCRHCFPLAGNIAVVGPGAADPHKGRAQCPRQRPQPR